MARKQTDVLGQSWQATLRFFLDPTFQAMYAGRHPKTCPEGPPGFQRVWPRVREHTILDVWRAESLARRLWEARDLPGDVIELGVYRGGTSIMMALLCQAWGLPKKVWMLDSFQGLPTPQDGVDAVYQRGWFPVDHRQVVRTCAAAGVLERLVIRPGWFEDTVKELGETRFCLAHLDSDLYGSTRTSLEGVAPRVVEGGAVVVDDYSDGVGGVKRAVDEHLLSSGERLHLAPTPQVYFRVGECETPRRRGRVTADSAELKRNKPYRAAMRYVHGRARQDARAFDQWRATMGW
jgi:O-methyltransferase